MINRCHPAEVERTSDNGVGVLDVDDGAGGHGERHAGGDGSTCRLR